MHPDVAREMIRQRAGERQARAARSQEARATREAARDQRSQATAARAIPLPRIPDYVDGTFRETENPAHAR